MSHPLPELKDQCAHCRKCGNDTTIRLPIHVELSVFTYWIKHTVCPECGAGYKSLDMVTTALPDPPDSDESMEASAALLAQRKEVR